MRKCKECGQEFEPHTTAQIMCDECEQEICEVEDEEDEEDKP